MPTLQELRDRLKSQARRLDRLENDHPAACPSDPIRPIVSHIEGEEPDLANVPPCPRCGVRECGVTFIEVQVVDRRLEVGSYITTRGTIIPPDPPDRHARPVGTQGASLDTAKPSTWPPLVPSSG